MSYAAEKTVRPEPSRWASLAEPQLCVMEALGTQLARVNALLENSFNELSTQFVQMAEDVKTYRNLTQGAGGEEAEATGQRIEAILSRSIMSMQFQDRVSQNLVITMDVLRVLAAELETQLSNAADGAPVDHEAARELHHFLRLGEIREEYLSVLLRRGYIAGAEELGLSASETHKGNKDDIELF